MIETDATHIADEMVVDETIADEVVQPDVIVADSVVQPDVVVSDPVSSAIADTEVTTPSIEPFVHIDRGFSEGSIG